MNKGLARVSRQRAVFLGESRESSSDYNSSFSWTPYIHLIKVLPVTNEKSVSYTSYIN